MKYETNNNVMITKNEKCSGCSACSAACPADAISMIVNNEGFLEPDVNSDMCINCGICLQVCPLDKETENKRVKSYYGWHKDRDVRDSSTSGGAFRAICDEVIVSGGIVFGAVYSDDFKSVIFADSDHTEMSKIQKSKYTVSNPDGIYPKIKAELENGRKVVFCGTPCQAAGLSRYLNKDYDNLTLVDFVCGGMPSLSFWQDHVEFLEKKFKSKIKGVDFRSKKNGWGKCYLEIDFDNGKKYFVREYLDSFYNCFMCGHVSIRKICHDCEFYNNHFADITIADFWGYRAAGIEDISNGLSLVIANNTKAAEFVESLKNFECNLLDNKFSDYAVAPVKSSEQDIQNRNKFFNMAKTMRFEKAANKLCPPTKFGHILQYINVKLKNK